jgi:hypothetical protein
MSTRLRSRFSWFCQGSLMYRLGGLGCIDDLVYDRVRKRFTDIARANLSPISPVGIPVRAMGRLTFTARISALAILLSIGDVLVCLCNFIVPIRSRNCYTSKRIVLGPDAKIRPSPFSLAGIIKRLGLLFTRVSYHLSVLAQGTLARKLLT